MAKDTKVVHFSIIDGTEEQIATLAKALATLKDKLPYDIEFLVTNDKIRLYDVEYFLKELYILYKKEKELVELVKRPTPKKESVDRNAATPLITKSGND